jgi:poly(3-hydroxybutyrate) depolymerase
VTGTAGVTGAAGAGAAGVTGAAGGGAAGSGAGPTPAQIPAHKETCPPIKSGAMTFLGQAVTVWAGTPTATSHGPVIFYWHGTGSNPQEALYGLGQAVINQITSQGGVVAAQAQTNGQGTNTGNGVWFTGDFDVADEIVACAIEQLHIDTRRIHSAGMSAGGLQTTWMAYARSSYIASVVPYSGGLTRALTLQDAGNVPAAMVVHGAMGSDVVVVDFATTSARYEADVKAKGGFAIDCNHGGNHMIPAGIGTSTWRFFTDHPYKVAPEPYAAGIPAGFPTYCRIP